MNDSEIRFKDLSPGDAEQWLRKLLEMVVVRRGTMYRFIGESVRTLLFANAGGVAMIISFIRVTGGDEKFHWLSLIPLMLFIVGALCSSATLILVTSVTVKEAHGMETALHDFVSKDLSRKDVMFQIEDKTQTLANFAAGFGVISAALFTLGCLFGLAQLIVFF